MEEEILLSDEEISKRIAEEMSELDKLPVTFVKFEGEDLHFSERPAYQAAHFRYQRDLELARLEMKDLLREHVKLRPRELALLYRLYQSSCLEVGRSLPVHVNSLGYIVKPDDWDDSLYLCNGESDESEIFLDSYRAVSTAISNIKYALKPAYKLLLDKVAGKIVSVALVSVYHLGD